MHNMGHISVDGHVNLVRDEDSTAILNTDNSQYNQYISLRNSRSKKNEKIDNMGEELQELKNELSEIKSLLKELVNG